MIHSPRGTSLATWPARSFSSSGGIRFASTPNLRINPSSMTTGAPARASHPSGNQPPIAAKSAPRRSSQSSTRRRMYAASMVSLVASSRTVPIEPFHPSAFPAELRIIRAAATPEHLIWKARRRFNTVRARPTPVLESAPPPPVEAPYNPSPRSTLFAARSCSIPGASSHSRGAEVPCSRPELQSRAREIST